MADAARYTVFIAEDEAPAREMLRAFVAGVAWLRMIGEAEDGPSAAAAIDELRPDIVLLDLELPGFDGLEVVRQVRHSPAIVITTAYDKHAVAAFELGAVDYLLKPFDRDRFRRAVDRVREARTHVRPGEAIDRLRYALLGGDTLRRVFVREQGRILPLAIDTIDWMEARGDYVALHGGGGRHLIHVALGALEERLDPARFVRVHRSHIVNVDSVVALHTTPSGSMEVELEGGRRLAVSRARAQELRGMVT